MFNQPLRYSEDIDLVQIQAEPIGETVDAIRATLSWLGQCRREQTEHSIHLVYRFAPEADPQATLRLKVEINTREHDNLFGLVPYSFRLENDWYSGESEVLSFAPEELFGTKLRALLQRRKNRDMFGLYHGLDQLALDLDKMRVASLVVSMKWFAPSSKPVTLNFSIEFSDQFATTTN